MTDLAAIERSVSGFPLLAAVKAELTKALTLRSWWIGVAVLLALNIYFAQMNASLLVELSATMDNGYFIDFDGRRESFERAVTDSILASPYQSAAMFLPLVIAIVVGHEYREHQILLSVTAVPNRSRLVIAKICAVVLLTSTVVLIAFISSDVILLLLLPDPAPSIITSGAGILIAGKILLYAITMCLVAGALTTIFRNTIPALVVIVLILLLSLSGALGALAPGLDNILPMIGAKTLLFGYANDSDSFTAGQGMFLLAVWLISAVTAWLAVFRKRDLT